MNTSQPACFLTVAETTMEELRGERLIVGGTVELPGAAAGRAVRDDRGQVGAGRVSV